MGVVLTALKALGIRVSLKVWHALHYGVSITQWHALQKPGFSISTTRFLRQGVLDITARSGDKCSFSDSGTLSNNGFLCELDTLDTYGTLLLFTARSIFSGFLSKYGTLFFGGLLSDSGTLGNKWLSLRIRHASKRWSNSHIRHAF